MGHDQMSAQSEPTICEYARAHGLTYDHRNDNLLSQLLTPTDFSTQLENPPASVCVEGYDKDLPVERLFIDAATAALLSAVIRQRDAPPEADEGSDIFNQGQRDYKQDLPLLRSDHAYDLDRFRKVVQPDLANEFLPLETLDEEADECLIWPTSFAQAVEKLHGPLTSEKLELSLESLRYLAEISKIGSESYEAAVLYTDGASLLGERSSMPEPVSPPLMPMSPDCLSLEPFSDTAHLDMLSDCTSPTQEDIRRVEMRIFESDVFEPCKKEIYSSPQNCDPMSLDTKCLGDIYSPLRGIQKHLSSPSKHQVLRGDLRVEVPLSPPQSERRPPWQCKGVSSKNALQDIVPSMHPAILPRDAMLDEIDTFFNDTIKPIGLQAERKIEQEKLQEADTTRRMSVPVMDFARQLAPWKVAFHGDHDSNDERFTPLKLLKDLKSIHLKNDVWRLNARSQGDLQWMPFPASLGKVELQETVGDDQFLVTYLVLPQDIHDERSKCQPGRSRISALHDESEQEILEDAVFPDGTDIDSLVRKRKFELSDEDRLFSSRARNNDPRVVESDGSDNSKDRIYHVAQPLSRPDCSISTLGSLETFIGTRKGLFSASNAFDSLCLGQKSSTAAKANPDTEIGKPSSLQVHSELSTSRLTLPSFVVPIESRSFIIASSLLKARPLTRCIQDLFPTASFIERDYSQHTSTHIIPTKSKSPLPPPYSADSSDLILSPSTGLLLTTIQKTKQRSLPGQSTHSALHERITQVAPLYENLFILVSEDMSSSASSSSTSTSTSGMTNPCKLLDQNDCEALIQLSAFTATLPSETHVIYVAGGLTQLAHWIVTLMIQSSSCCPYPAEPDYLVQDETHQELFLRRAGMNAAAAQVVLSMLDGRNESAQWRGQMGLAAFVKMGAEERVRRFEGVLGGSRVLGRVSAVLDAPW